MQKEILRTLFKNPVLANILMMLIIVCGIFGTMVMVRETFPRFSLDVITVTVSYPGADPEEIEEGICLKLEEALEGIEGVKKITTTASEGSGTAVIECKENANLYEVKDEVKTLVDGITTFPVDAENPIVTEVKFRGDVVTIAIWGDLPERQLKEVARKLEQDLLKMPGVSQTSISGIRDYQISIEISEEKLRKYGISFNDISNAVKKNGLNLPAGTIRTGVEDFRIRAMGRKYKAKDYRDIPVIVRTDGTVITLEQIADIRDVFDEDSEVIALFNGKPTVALNVFKTEEEDAIKISKQVDKFLAEKRAELPKSIQLTKFKDRSKLVTDRLTLLINNGKIGLLLVFLSLWIFLDLRLSFWVTMGIPISLAGALALMAATGQTINMLSMFGLIMVLGLIVDDAIVVGESIYSYRQKGESAFMAAVNGTSEVALPVIAAVTTTVVAFIPLYFIGGVMGKFIRVIPTPVVASLSVSLVEGLFILPIHLRHLPIPKELPKFKFIELPKVFIKYFYNPQPEPETAATLPEPEKPASGIRRIFGTVSKPVMAVLRFPSFVRSCVASGLEYFIEHIYGPFIDRVLHWRYVCLSMAVTVLLIIAGLVSGGIIKFVLIPEADDDFIRCKIEMPAGTPIEHTKAAAQQVLNGWYKVEKKFKIKETQNSTITKVINFLKWATGGKVVNAEDSDKPFTKAIYTIIGGSLDWREGSGNPSKVEVSIELLPAEERNIFCMDLIHAWEKETGKIPGSLATSFQKFRHGPGGSPIEIKLLGNDHKQLITAADELVEKLSSIEGVFDAQTDYRPGKREFSFKIKPEAYHLGLSLDDIARHIKGGFYGDEALRIQRGRDDVKVKIRYPEKKGRNSIEYFEKLRIKTPRGFQVPFKSVADLTLTEGQSQILREHRNRAVTVTADVNNKLANAREILTDLEANFMPQMLNKYDISYSTEGQSQETRDSLSSLFIGFPLALFGIFFIIASMFRSYIQPLVIMTTIPFGLIGAVIGHLIFGFPLTLLSMFGMVALAGIVVNDAIVLIEGVNTRLEEGMPLFVALREGGKRRFRAILLTTLTTFSGLMPLILEKSMQAQFLIPMAISIAFGVLFATVLTLVLIPCLMAILNDLRRFIYLLWHFKMPSREQMEPRSCYYGEAHIADD